MPDLQLHDSILQRPKGAELMNLSSRAGQVAVKRGEDEYGLPQRRGVSGWKLVYA